MSYPQSYFSSSSIWMTSSYNVKLILDKDLCEIPQLKKIMEQDEYSAYLVIKIPIQNRNDHERYECVPRSWLKVKDEDDNIVVFGYPLEDSLHTKLRVLEHQPLDNTWPAFYGEVVYDTDSQNAAFRCLERKMEQHESDIDQTKNTNDKVGEITTPTHITINLINLTSNRTNHPSKQKKPDPENILQSTTVCNELGKEVDLEISEAHDIIRTYARDLECEATEFSSTSEISHDTQIPDPTKIIPNETDDEARKENAKKIMERPRRKSTCQLKSYFEFSDEEFDRSDDSDYAPEIVNSDSNVGIHNSPQPRSSEVSIPVGVNNSLDHEDITMNLLDDPVHAYLYNFYVDINESYQKTMTSFDNAADYVHKIITARKEKVEAKANPSSTDKHTESMNSIMFSNPQPLLRERISVNHEDTKWTLRYPKPGPETIELLPYTGVYVSREGLSECKSTSSKTTKFTRSLLEEVFTDEALKTCTFSGRAGKRPGLNFKARQTLMKYALEYSLKMNWEKADLNVIANCIRNKLTRSNKNKN